MKLSPGVVGGGTGGAPGLVLENDTACDPSVAERARKSSVTPGDSLAGPLVLVPGSKVAGHSRFSTSAAELLDCACRGERAATGGAARKSCVKLPSADAESEAPGEEKPFILGVLAGAVDTGLAAGRSGGGTAGDANMRVTSPEIGLGASRGTPMAGGEDAADGD